MNSALSVTLCRPKLTIRKGAIFLHLEAPSNISSLAAEPVSLRRRRSIAHPDDAHRRLLFYKVEDADRGGVRTAQHAKPLGVEDWETGLRGLLDDLKGSPDPSTRLRRSSVT